MFLSPPELLTADEEGRLLTLSEYDILHSLREAVFDELVKLVAHVFKLPIALIALVGAEEVGYKAALGLPGLTRHPRQASVCALVVRRNQAVVLTDMAQPDQYRQLTAAAYDSIQQHRLRFYAGVPLRMPNQRVVGTFCIIDRRARTLHLPELRVLEQLAHLIERVIVVRHACLASKWLESEPWSLVQGYITSKLRELTYLARTVNHVDQPTCAVAPAVLRAVVRDLNTLASVLAEPLPGFA